MNSLSLCSLFLILCLFFIFQSPLPTNARVQGHHRLLGDNPDFINQICNDQTIHDKTNCTDIMRTDPNISRATNFFDLSVATFSAAISKVIQGQNLFRELVTREHFPATAAIQECDYDYQLIVDDFRIALDDLMNNNDTVLAKHCALDAGDAVSYCDTVLATVQFVDPAISALNYQTTLLSLIAFLATSKLPSS